MTLHATIEPNQTENRARFDVLAALVGREGMLAQLERMWGDEGARVAARMTFEEIADVLWAMHCIARSR
jgi:hypothetical protein